MNYSELIAKALKGRSVNAAAKDWGLRQATLDRWTKSKGLPDYTTTIKMAQEAGVDLKEAVLAVAAEEQALKVKNFELQMGFVQIELLLSIATLGVLPILYIMSNCDGSTKTIYIVFLTPVFESHHASYVH